MFGYTYKLESTDKNDIIKLTPTTSTLAKTFGVGLAMGLLPLVMPLIQEKLESKEYQRYTRTLL